MQDLKVGDIVQRRETIYKKCEDDEDEYPDGEKIHYSRVLIIMDGIVLLSQEGDNFEVSEGYTDPHKKAGSWKTMQEMSDGYKIVSKIN